MKKKIKVGVVFGGPSNEHEVSVNSGKNVLQNLNPKKYKVISIKIPKKGNWLIPFIKKIKKVDVVFLALHGEFGEDGKIQAVLGTLHIPYTGSGVRASSVAINKMATYKFLSDKKIYLPKSQLLNTKKEKVIIQFPLVVKPNSSGSSVGISIVKNSNELPKALVIAFKEDKKVLVEEYIQGKELSCGVLGNSKELTKALPVAEVRTAGIFFDYNSKYNDKRTQEICPAPISKKLERQIQEISMEIHLTLDCRGLTRSDYILSKNKLYFLEVNTTPGLTKGSLVPKMAHAMGWSLQVFFDKQIKLALQNR